MKKTAPGLRGDYRHLFNKINSLQANKVLALGSRLHR